MTKEEYILKRDSDLKKLVELNEDIEAQVNKLIGLCESGSYSANTSCVDEISNMLMYLNMEIALQKKRLNGEL